MTEPKVAHQEMSFVAEQSLGKRHNSGDLGTLPLAEAELQLCQSSLELMKQLLILLRKDLLKI